VHCDDRSGVERIQSRCEHAGLWKGLNFPGDSPHHRLPIRSARAAGAAMVVVPN